MTRPIKPIIFALVACALLGAQAIAPAHVRATNQEQDQPELKFDVELELLHQGSAEYLLMDQSLGVVLLQASVNGEETTALLDTGASGTSIDVELATRIGLRVEKAGTKAKTVFGFIENYLVYGATIEVPSQFRFSSTTGGKDLTGLSRSIGKPVGLIIGMDVLRSLSFLIDSKRSRVVFLKSGAIKPRSGTATRFDLEGDTVSGTIAGKQAVFEVDLGTNSEILVLQDSWSRLFDDKDDLAVRKSFDATGNEEVSRGLYNVPITIGPIAAKASVERVALQDDGVDALIGYPLFKDRVTIFDYSAGHFTIITE